MTGAVDKADPPPAWSAAGGAGRRDGMDGGHRRTRLFAILLMCAAVFLFAILDTTAKWLGRSYSPFQVAWCRYAFHVVFAALALNPITSRQAWVSHRLGLQIVRSFLLAASTLLNFLALGWLRLDQTMTITFATPLVVATFAGPMLGEWIGPKRLAAVCVGFLGVILVTRPGFAGFHPAYLIAIACMLAYSFYGITTRIAARYDSSSTSFVYTGLVGAAVLAPALPFVWIWPADLFDWLLFALLGLLGGVGHLLLIIAHRRAPAPVLSAFIYTEMIWMIILGRLVFDDLPDRWTLAGAGIVIGAGFYLVLQERVDWRRRRA
jgi:drug/metabolite transporter (DMT)-like permease